LGKIRNSYKILVGKPGQKKSLGKPRIKWKGNIKIGLVKWGERVWTAFVWLKMGLLTASCER
jgi:hypothetical protein